MTLESPPQWSPERLRTDSQVAIERFRQQRMQEPLEAYLEAFDRYRAAVENLLEMTVDLSQIDESAVQVLSDPALMEAARYLAGPPISEDDLRVLAEAQLAPTRLRRDPAMARRVIDTVLFGLDRHRFPWVAEDREPTDSERAAAAMASAALMVSQRVATDRRNASKRHRRPRSPMSSRADGLKQVPRRRIRTLDDAPGRGEFCGESILGSRKADLVIRLWDGRAMPLECKVSNSSVNSIKRLNNDAAAKAEAWIADFGRRQVVPAAVLSGVFREPHLRDAQERGLTLFWSHSLGELVSFIERTRAGS